jgi:hypothetical protein
MSRAETYRQELRSVDPDALEAWVMERSGLPGPRGNLELLDAISTDLPAATLRAWAARSPEVAPGGTAGEFLPACGAAGLGRLLVEAGVDAGARAELLAELHRLARDPRWRVREGVAMALQRWGRIRFGELLAVLHAWASEDDRLVQRAAVAALCEPALLRDEARAVAVLDVLDAITATLPAASDRRTEPYRVLRQALGYGWSVAAVAAPVEGRRRIERWLASDDPDVAWVMHTNLGKARLARMDPAWVERWQRPAAAGR